MAPGDEPTKIGEFEGIQIYGDPGLRHGDIVMVSSAMIPAGIKHLVFVHPGRHVVLVPFNELYGESARQHAERIDEHMRLAISNSMLVKELPARFKKPEKKYWVQERGAQWKANRVRHNR